MNCFYCNKDFLLKIQFDEHQCEGTKRLAFIKTLIGINCFEIYKKWMKYYKNNIINDNRTFITCRYFISILKFYDYKNKMQIPSIDSFLKYAVAENLPPTLWNNDNVYINYIKNLDNYFLPEMQINETCIFIYELSSKNNYKPSQIFDNMNEIEIKHAIQTRKLSPWIILLSKKFKNRLLNMQLETKLIIENIINPKIWIEKIKNNPKALELSKKMIIKLDI